MFQEMIRQIQRAETISYTGKIENIVGMSIEASGGRAAVGDICQIYNGDAGGQVMAEVVGFKNDHILLMPYSDMSGISAGNFVRNTGRRLSLRMGPFLKGRVINALGQPIDGKGPFQGGTLFCVENNHYINPMTRPPIRERMEFGVKAIDSMLTIGKGQRIGISTSSPWWGSAAARCWNSWKRIWGRRGCGGLSWWWLPLTSPPCCASSAPPWPPESRSSSGTRGMTCC